jgi:hypothetical protein
MTSYGNWASAPRPKEYVFAGIWKLVPSSFASALSVVMREKDSLELGHEVFMKLYAQFEAESS